MSFDRTILRQVGHFTKDVLHTSLTRETSWILEKKFVSPETAWCSLHKGIVDKIKNVQGVEWMPPFPPPHAFFFKLLERRFTLCQLCICYLRLWHRCHRVDSAKSQDFWHNSNSKNELGHPHFLLSNCNQHDKMHLFRKCEVALKPFEEAFFLPVVFEL